MNLRTEIAAFISWWLQELREVAEATMGRIAPRLVKFVVVQEGQTDTGASPHVVRAVAVLNAKDVLLHEIGLPLAVEREVERAIDLHLERDLPMPRDRVCVDWRILKRDRAARRIQVRLIVAHRDRVERMRAEIAARGLRVVRVAVQGADGELIGDLLPRRIRADRLQLSTLERRLAAASAVLGLVALGLVGGQWLYERAQLADGVEKASALARRAESLTRQLKDGSSAAAELIAVMKSPDAVDVLSSLTEVSPQDTWAYELDVKPAAEGGYQLKFDGFAPAATMFVDALGKTPQFEQVRLVSATTAGLGTSRDRLQLTARYPKP